MTTFDEADRPRARNGRWVGQPEAPEYPDRLDPTVTPADAHSQQATPGCPECGDPSGKPTRIALRFDEDHAYTNQPPDAVWTQMSCGCTTGDQSLAPKRTEQQRKRTGWFGRRRQSSR